LIIRLVPAFGDTYAINSGEWIMTRVWIICIVLMISACFPGCTVHQQFKTDELGDNTHRVTEYRFIGIPYLEEEETTYSRLPK
jgi:hypothetical protein